MKILYGVVGEGMGHATRSRVILAHLVKSGHQIEVMASGRACDFLSKHFKSVHRISGLHMIYEENRMRLGKTILSNAKETVQGLPKNIAAYFDSIDRFEPEVVISDFESWVYTYAKLHRLPILSIDNMQIIHRCSHASEIVKGEQASFQLTKAFVKGKLPGCDDYFITSFFRPEIRKQPTTLFPPILREQILHAKREDGEHLLVYQTGEGYDALTQVLQDTGLPCRVYGMRRDLKESVTEGNLTYMPFSEDGFIQDLATCKAVIAGGGFTLMGEAVYLHKPMLSVPLAKQFEQVMNARYLEAEGYGMSAADLASPGVVAEFLSHLPRYRDALKSYSQDGNHDILSAVDSFLDKAAAGIAKV
jgi:uncharacterized protein (TIGR00661 family)